MLFSNRLLRPRTVRALGHRGFRQNTPSLVECLENRTLLTAYLVDTLDDTVAVDGKVSLREAVQAASSNLAVNEAAAGSTAIDSITFDASLAGGTIVLGGTRLDVTGALSITGLGTTQLTISGNDAVQIFAVAAGSNLQVSNVTLTDGFGASGLETRDGGTIENYGTVALNYVVISNSTTSFRGAAIYNEGSVSMAGGAIRNSTGTYAVENYGAGSFDAANVSFDNNLAGVIFNWKTISILACSFYDNVTSGGAAVYNFGSQATATVAASQFNHNVGGALKNQGVTFRIFDSSFTNNSASSAGAVDNFSGVMEISGSTFSQNHATTFHGGAIENSGTLRMSNSTVSGNDAAWNGGAFYIWTGTATFRNVTVFGNRGKIASALGDGGGFYITGSSTVVSLYNSIVAGNTIEAGGTPQDIVGLVSGSNNIIGTAGAAGGLLNGTNGNIVGVNWTTVLDPVLRDNGGPTKTHALLTGSVAINAGSDAEAVDGNGMPLGTDQRGPGFARRLFQVDIGAFEVQTTPNAVVDTLTDEDDGDYGAGDLSLREAIKIVAEGGTVSFAASLAGGTIGLTRGQIALDRDVTIAGTNAVPITISGSDLSRIFFVGAAATVSLRDLTLTHGNAAGSTFDERRGGAIYNQGWVLLNDVDAVANHAMSDGGAIYNNGTLFVTGGSVSGNSANSGGGIYNDPMREVTLNAVTLSSNTGSLGGAVYNAGTLTATDVVWSSNSGSSGAAMFNGRTATIAGGEINNNSATLGGGLYNSIGTLIVSNAAFVGNSASSGGAIYGSGTISVVGSSFSANSASFRGGAIASNSTLKLTNSTVSGNSSTGDGGGLAVNTGAAVLRNVTLFGNRADADGNGVGTGGGMHVSAGTATLYNTIVAGNVRGTGSLSDDVGGVVAASSSHNLIGDAATSGGLTNGVNGNIVGVDWTTVLDPVLRDNGGPTLTHALLTGSVAVDAGSDAEAVDADGQPLMFDQRGNGFPRILRARVDIGAFEAMNSPPVAFNDGFDTDDSSVVTGNLFDENGVAADSDPDGDSLSVTSINGTSLAVGKQIKLASGAFLTVNADGTFSYDPGAAFLGLHDGETAADGFTYTVSDGFGGTASASVQIILHGLSVAPFARDDAFQVSERGSSSHNLFANDSDVDGDPLAVSAVNGDTAHVGKQITLASGALLTVNADGTFNYDPNGRFNQLRRGQTATESFTYTVTDSHGGTATATVTLTIRGGGQTDLIGYLDGQWRVGVSNATSFTSSTWTTWSDSDWSTLQQGDFNGDGLTDVLGLIRGAWWVGLSNGSSFVTTRWGVWANLAWQNVTVGDLDGDGDDDILARYLGSWWVGLSDGSGFAAQRWSVWSDRAWQHVSLVDLDADGDDDLLANLNGAWWVSLSTGSGFAAPTRWGALGNLAWDAIGTFDANGDGRTDFYALYHGRWYVGLSDGTAFAISLRSAWRDAAWADAMAGDFDGDGRDDLAARLGGVWWVSLSSATGGAGSTNRWAVWSNTAWKDVTIGDFNGDGRDDLAARVNGNWWVAVSNGTVFTTSLWGSWQNADWKAVAAGVASETPPAAPTASFQKAWAASDDESLGLLWSSLRDDEEFAASLLAV